MRTERVMRFGGERGAVLIIFAAFALVAVLMLAFVIDIGAMRQEKREVTLSTDAAALAGVVSAEFAGMVTDRQCDLVALNAESLLLYASEVPPPTTVEDVVSNYLKDNGGSELIDCTVYPDGKGSGYIQVVARDTVDYAFSGAVGQSAGDVSGTSSASFTLDLGGGLRPIGVCELTNSLDSSPLDFGDELAKIKGLPITETRRFEITLPLERLNDADDCGSASGHFGQIDFADDGNAQGNCDPTKPEKLNPDTYCEYLYNGWFGELSPTYSGDTGNNYGQPVGMFEYIKNSGIHFFVPVYNEVPDCKGNPKPDSCESVTGAPFKVSYYAEVSLANYCLDGDAKAACRIERDVNSDSKISNDERFRWFKFDVYGAIAAPVDKLPKTADAEPIPARICAVSPDTSYCG